MNDIQLLQAVADHHRNYQDALDYAHNQRINLQDAVNAARQAGWTLREVGEILGVTAQRVEQIQKAA